MLAYVLDDDPAQLLLASRMLVRLGWETRGAPDCDSLHRLCAQAPPDLALCDVNVGRDDGIEFCRKLRELCPSTRCIIMSGDPENEERAIGAGFRVFLRKPFALEDLALLVQ